jgi:hypothetical protein
MRAIVCRVGVYVWHTTVCMAALALALGVFWGTSYALSVHDRRQAERLLQQLVALQTRTPGYRTAQQIARDFGGKEHCISEVCAYDFDNGVAVRSSWLPRLLRRTEWDYLGLRPWEVMAHIETRNSKLDDMEFLVSVGRGRGWLYNDGLLSGSMWACLLVSITSNDGQFEQQLRLRQESDRRFSMRAGELEDGSGGLIVKKPSLDTPGGGEALKVYLSPMAPPESIRVALDSNLRCVTRMLPCTDLSQLAPSSWRFYSQLLKSR